MAVPTPNRCRKVITMTLRHTVAPALLFTFVSLAVAGNSPDPVHELEAPISSINVEEGTFVAGGVTIVVTPQTEIELPNDRPAQLGDLKVGSTVEIQGVVKEGQWEAREVEVQRKPLPIIGKKNDHGVEGIVDSVDAANRSFTVGGVVVKIGEKTILKDDDAGKITIGQLAVGDEVEVEGTFKNNQL